MLISYDPMSDILTVTHRASPVAQTQMQGTVTVGFDAAGSLVSVSIPEASSVLWERGGQVNIMLPETQTVVTQVVERRPTLG